jgi:hypothetical protein
MMDPIKITPTLTLKPVSQPYHRLCYGCYLNQFINCTDIKVKHVLHCSPVARADGLNVIFKKVAL